MGLIQKVPKKSTDYSAEERAKFPRFIHKSENYVLDWEAPENTTEEEYRQFLVQLDEKIETEKLASKPLPK